MLFLLSWVELRKNRPTLLSTFGSSPEPYTSKIFSQTVHLLYSLQVRGNGTLFGKHLVLHLYLNLFALFVLSRL